MLIHVQPQSPTKKRNSFSSQSAFPGFPCLTGLSNKCLTKSSALETRVRPDSPLAGPYSRPATPADSPARQDSGLVTVVQ